MYLRASSYRSSKGCLIASLCTISAICAAAGSWLLASTSVRTDEVESMQLEPGTTVERVLSVGARHGYTISLSAGQYVRVEVNQPRMDLGLSLRLPDGKVLLLIASGLRQDLAFSRVAELSGSYGITVYARPRAPAIPYQIRISELRAANESDYAVQEGRKLLDEGLRLNREGRFGEARSLMTRALEIAEIAFGAEAPELPPILRPVAIHHQNTGDYVASGRLFERALKILERTHGTHNPEYALTLYNYGILLERKGDWFEAEASYRRAYGIFQETGQTENLIVSALLQDLGGILKQRGDLENAERHYLDALAIYENLLGADHFHLAYPMAALGQVAYTTGDYPSAERLFQQARALSEKGLGPDNLVTARNSGSLAALYSTTGEYEKAESLYLQALSSFEATAGMRHPDAREILYGLARLYAAQERSSDAVSFQSRALELEEQHIALNLAVGSERARLAFLDNLALRSSRAISMHTRLAPDDEDAMHLAVTTLVQRKGRVQDAMSAGLASLHQRSADEDRRLLDALAETTSRLAYLYLQGPHSSDRLKHLQDLEKQREMLEREISSRSAGFYDMRRSVELAEVRALIPERSVLLEIGLYRPFDPRLPDDERAYGEGRYVAYVLRRQGELHWADLGEAKTIDEAVAAFRNALRDRKRSDVMQLARQLDAKLLEPLRRFLQGAERLLISPDGSLNLVPFAALRDSKGRYLIEDHTISYLTSGRDLLRMQVTRPSKSGPLLLADPDFGDSPVDAAGGSPAFRKRPVQLLSNEESAGEFRFLPLHGTAEEARAIKELFPDMRVLTGAEATESALKKIAAPRILHLATHGIFTGPDVADESSSRARSTDNPLLRSRLALAGANRRPRSDDDGILTALEASALNLWGTKLVVLSACDTGVGQVKNGEGVYGLRRALVLAGAETIVMSLWPVSDYVTRELMTGYYRGLKEGLGRGEALRRVQLGMLRSRERRHPFYWASFIQSGDWSGLEGPRVNTQRSGQE